MNTAVLLFSEHLDSGEHMIEMLQAYITETG